MSSLRRSNMYLLVALAAALLTAPLAATMHPASAQMNAQQQPAQQDQNMRLLGQRMLNGTVNLRQDIKTYLQNNLKVSLTEAVSIAQKADSNAKVFSARIAVIQGSIVYRVVMVNMDTRTIHVIFVDAGNGKILASPQISLRTLYLLMRARGGPDGMLTGQYRQLPIQSHPLLAQRIINGSVNIRDEVKNFLKNNVKETFTDAVAAAQKADPNGKVLAARITLVHGFVVYRVILVNLDTRTIHVIFVDAGNGSILASPQISLRSLFFLMHARAAGGTLRGQMG